MTIVAKQRQVLSWLHESANITSTRLSSLKNAVFVVTFTWKTCKSTIMKFIVRIRGIEILCLIWPWSNIISVHYLTCWVSSHNASLSVSRVRCADKVLATKAQEVYRDKNVVNGLWCTGRSLRIQLNVHFHSNQNQYELNWHSEWILIWIPNVAKLFEYTIFACIPKRQADFPMKWLKTKLWRKFCSFHF